MLIYVLVLRGSPWTGCMHLHPEHVENICCGTSRRPSPAHGVCLGVSPQIAARSSCHWWQTSWSSTWRRRRSCRRVASCWVTSWRCFTGRMWWGTWIWDSFNVFHCPVTPEHIIFYRTDNLLTCRVGCPQYFTAQVDRSFFSTMHIVLRTQKCSVLSFWDRKLGVTNLN